MIGTTTNPNGERRMCGIGLSVTWPPGNAVVSPPILAACECAPSWHGGEKRKTMSQITPRIRNSGVNSEPCICMMAPRLERQRILRKFYYRVHDEFTLSEVARNFT